MDANAMIEPCFCTAQSIAAFLEHEQDAGASAVCLRQRKNHIQHLYNWLPPEKQLNYEGLRQWRQSLKDAGCSEVTVGNYAKNINRYLDFIGRSDLRFTKGKAKNIAGMQFGRLIATESVGKTDRNDYVWRCRCVCGKEVEVPATRLLTGNTSSCGCVKEKNLRDINQYIDHTSIRSAMTDQVHSKYAVSGYTGVAPKRGKWYAYITYKRKRYHLGAYNTLEDAIKARSHAKEIVMEDARRLRGVYEALCEGEELRSLRRECV